MTEQNTLCFKRRRVNLAKKPSPAFRHEYDVGVTWNIQRGWRVSHPSDLDVLAGGITEIVINRRHPAYEKLVRVLDPDVSESNSRDLVERINNASDMLRMLLAAWARYEEEDTWSQSRISEMRYEWGKMARAFMSEDS